MNYLFIDASENLTHIQVGNKTSFITESIKTDRNLAACITASSDEVLKKFKISKDEVDLYVLCSGPGGLTGLRVASAFIRTSALIKKTAIFSIDLFTWAAQTLKDKNFSGDCRLIIPTLIDSAFESSLSLPNGTPAQPNLINRNIEPDPKLKTFGIRYHASGVELLTPDFSSLHNYIVSNQHSTLSSFDEILSTLPLYVIASQAERKLSGEI